ncbi:hypothetical protein J3E68DRAFT_418437 [Trichoderma sp. SZMC 28012]
MRAWLIGGSGPQKETRSRRPDAKRACPQLLVPPRVEEREYWFRIGPEPAAWQSLCEACMGLGRRPTPTTSNAMQTSPHCWVQGSSANSRAFCMYAQYSMDFLGGLTHRKQRVTVCKERECVCVCMRE